MESVGRLAGGVAHDFNNMLGVILGHAELALEQADAAMAPISANLREIKKAGERSAALTQQLLALARKQTVAPRVLDLNETIDGTLSMLRRLIGENIDLAWLPGHGLGRVKMDSSQIDQILTNIALNARDAIQGNGKITIETAEAAFSDSYCAEHPGFVPGRYVSLMVSDNGCGMNQETLSHIFEPFFSTKGIGEGTGLGLATVYGIVKQNNGFINVYSEVDHGTTLKVYFPSLKEDISVTSAAGPTESNLEGTETILLVEDESSLLKLSTAMLERFGYKVLAARTPHEAMRMAQEHGSEVQILLTDVVMPEMNGKDLAVRLQSLFPNLKTLFMSGYTANVIAHHGVLDEGLNFIQKPFSARELAKKIRQALSDSHEPGAGVQ
jgi:CheY-like chemotaxis protein